MIKIVGDPASFIADRQAGMVTSIDSSRVGESERIGGGRRMGKGERTVSMGEKRLADMSTIPMNGWITRVNVQINRVIHIVANVMNVNHCHVH